MTSSDRYSPAIGETEDTLSWVRDRQESAAHSSTTIGEFARRWKQDVADILLYPTAGGEGARAFEDWRDAVQKRDVAIRKASRGNEDIRIAPMALQFGGVNTIGAGRNGMRLNQFHLAHLGEQRTALDERITVAHEAAHGRSVQLLGALLDDDHQPIEDELIHEGYAEVSSMDEEGGGFEKKRSDQPEDLYGEGQRLMLQIIRKVGREAVERTLTVDGDVSRLQAAFSNGREKVMNGTEALAA